jgi:SAM-dependent methyltransferase
MRAATMRGGGCAVILGSDDWAAYVRATAGREPRPLFERGLDAVHAARMTPGQAVELGFGDGTETLALLEDGWRVLAVDPTPAAAELLLAQVPPGHAGRLEVRVEPAQSVDLPPFELLYAGYGLPFLPPGDFDRCWAGIRACLAPGGFLVVNVFGPRDGWAGEPGMTFLARGAVEDLVDGLEVLVLEENEADGASFRGPKHWHVFDVVARRPADAGR